MVIVVGIKDSFELRLKEIVDISASQFLILKAERKSESLDFAKTVSPLPKWVSEHKSLHSHAL